MVITSLRDDAMRNLRLAANPIAVVLGFGCLLMIFCKERSCRGGYIVVYERLPFSQKKRPSHIEIAVRIQILKSK